MLSNRRQLKPDPHGLNGLHFSPNPAVHAPKKKLYPLHTTMNNWILPMVLQSTTSTVPSTSIKFILILRASYTDSIFLAKFKTSIARVKVREPLKMCWTSLCFPLCIEYALLVHLSCHVRFWFDSTNRGGPWTRYGKRDNLAKAPMQYRRNQIIIEYCQRFNNSAQKVTPGYQPWFAV